MKASSSTNTFCPRHTTSAARSTLPWLPPPRHRQDEHPTLNCTRFLDGIKAHKLYWNRRSAANKAPVFPGLAFTITQAFPGSLT
jgi:hypothetical protein